MRQYYSSQLGEACEKNEPLCYRTLCYLHDRWSAQVMKWCKLSAVCISVAYEITLNMYRVQYLLLITLLEP